MSGIDTEILVVVGYSLFLLVAAACLEAVARHSHLRSERLHVAGFRYDSSADLWTCPNNENISVHMRLRISVRTHCFGNDSFRPIFLNSDSC